MGIDPDVIFCHYKCLDCSDGVLEVPSKVFQIAFCTTQHSKLELWCTTCGKWAINGHQVVLHSISCNRMLTDDWLMINLMKYVCYPHKTSIHFSLPLSSSRSSKCTLTSAGLKNTIKAQLHRICRSLVKWHLYFNGLWIRFIEIFLKWYLGFTSCNIVYLHVSCLCVQRSRA